MGWKKKGANPMNCKECEMELMENIGNSFNSLPFSLQKHVAECTSCSQEWKSLCEMHEDLQWEVRLPDEEDLLWQRQRISILQNIKNKKSFSFFPRWAWTFPVVLLLALATYQFKGLMTPYSISSNWVEEMAEEEVSADELIDEMTPDQLQIAIKQMQNKTNRGIL